MNLSPLNKRHSIVLVTYIIMLLVLPIGCKDLSQSVSKDDNDGRLYAILQHVEENQNTSIQMSESSIYTLSLCNLALMSRLGTDARIQKTTANRILAQTRVSLHCISDVKHINKSSSAAYLAAIALYQGSLIFNDQHLEKRSIRLIAKLRPPSNVNSSLASIMFMLSSAAKLNGENLPSAIALNDPIKTFRFIDSSLPYSCEYYFRLHLRAVLFWSESLGRPQFEVIQEMLVNPNDVVSNEKGQNSMLNYLAFVELTLNTFELKKIGAPAGIYGYIRSDGNLQDKHAVEDDVEPVIEFGHR